MIGKDVKYRKSQWSAVMISFFSSGLALLVFLYVKQWGNNPLPLTPFLVVTLSFLVIISIFYKLTVKIKGTTLEVVYGIGLVRITFKIDSLERVEIIKIPWYYGLGIRITPKGMLYNIQGSKAVNIEYVSNGKRKVVMVGSPEPEQLISAIEENWRR